MAVTDYFQKLEMFFGGGSLDKGKGGQETTVPEVSKLAGAQSCLGVEKLQRLMGR